MANMCSNYVTFSGTYENLKPLYDNLAKIVKTSEQNLEIRLDDYPNVFDDFIYHTGDYYMGDILDENSDGFVLEFLTRWSPKEDCVIKLAEHYKVDFILAYEEGSSCFGAFKYEEKVLMERSLDDMEVAMINGKYGADLDGIFDYYESYLETKPWILCT